MEAESLVLQLQQQIHDQNQSRWEAIESEQAAARAWRMEQADTIARIEENTRSLPTLVERVDALEKTDSKHKGAFGVLGVAWAGLLCLVEWYSHR